MVRLVASYARSIVAEKIAAGELAAAPIVDGKPSPWLAVWQAKVRALTTLGRILRLTPQSRAPLAAKQQNLSYYEKMALERGHGPDAN